jgi:hypothetical protein
LKLPILPGAIVAHARQIEKGDMGKFPTFPHHAEKVHHLARKSSSSHHQDAHFSSFYTKKLIARGGGYATRGFSVGRHAAEERDDQSILAEARWIFFCNTIGRGFSTRSFSRAYFITAPT